MYANVISTFTVAMQPPYNMSEPSQVFELDFEENCALSGTVSNIKNV
jgi:hypothetical protein